MKLIILELLLKGLAIISQVTLSLVGEGRGAVQFVGEQIVSSHHCYFYLSSSGWMRLDMGYTSVSPVQYIIRFLGWIIDPLPLEEKFQNHLPSSLHVYSLGLDPRWASWGIWRVSNVRPLRLFYAYCVDNTATLILYILDTHCVVMTREFN